MTSYQESDNYADPADEYDEVEEEHQRGRDPRGFVRGTLILIVVILILLLFRGCGRSTSESGGTQGTKTIEAVEGSEMVDGMVSLWVEDGADAGEVLSGASVSATGRIDMGDGHWVVTVPSGSEKAAVKSLKRAPGVVDAGLVYGNKDAAAGLSP